jgi:hypothetical protein
MRHLILAALAVGMAAVLYLSPKPYMLTNVPAVEPVASLPPSTDLLKLRRFLNYSAYVIPKIPADLQAEVRPPALGYSFREVSVLKLPLFAYADQGKVLYIETADRVQMVPLDADYLALLEKEAGAASSTRLTPSPISGPYRPFVETCWPASPRLDMRRQSGRREWTGS